MPNNDRRRGTGGYEQPFQPEAVARNPFYDTLKGKSSHLYDSPETASPYDNTTGTGRRRSNENDYDDPTAFVFNPYDNSSIRSQAGGGNVNIYDNPEGVGAGLYEELP